VGKQLTGPTRSMDTIAEAIPELLRQPPHSAAIIFRTPEGKYGVTGADGITGSPKNDYIFSRDQLAALMWELQIYSEQLADPGILAKLAGHIAAYKS